MRRRALLASRRPAGRIPPVCECSTCGTGGRTPRSRCPFPPSCPRPPRADAPAALRLLPRGPPHRSGRRPHRSHRRWSGLPPLPRRSVSATLAAPRRSHLDAGGRWQEVGVHLLRELQPGDRSKGRRSSPRTTPPGGGRSGLDDGSDRARRTAAGRSRRGPEERLSTAADPVSIEIFNNRFASIAAQMGTTLRKTSAVDQLKERLDFSWRGVYRGGRTGRQCAAHPGTPGAMGETGRTVPATIPDRAQRRFPHQRPL